MHWAIALVIIAIAAAAALYEWRRMITEERDAALRGTAMYALLERVLTDVNPHLRRDA
jgi:type II secretory pathway pseudopilin PulG